MFFLFRCAFWLGIVFYHLPWPGGVQPAEQARAALAELNAAATKTIAERAQSACLNAPRDCAAAAAKLARDAPTPSRASLKNADLRSGSAK